MLLKQAYIPKDDKPIDIVDNIFQGWPQTIFLGVLAIYMIVYMCVDMCNMGWDLYMNVLITFCSY